MRARNTRTTAIETGELYGDAAVRLFALDHPQRAPGVREQGEPGSHELYGWPLQRGGLLDTTQADSTAHQGYTIPVNLVRANLPSESKESCRRGDNQWRFGSPARPRESRSLWAVLVEGTVRRDDQVEALS